MDTTGILIINSTLLSPTINFFHNEKNIIPDKIQDEYSELKSLRIKHKSNDVYLNKLFDVVNVLDRSKSFFKLLGIKSGIYVNFNVDSSYEIKCFNTESNIIEPFNELKKYKTLLYGKVGEEIYQYLKQFYTKCEREEQLYKYNIKLITILFDHVELDGNFYITFQIVCNSQQIEYIKLLTYLFKKITIQNGISIFCEGFLGDKLISKSDIVKITNRKFTIEDNQYNSIVNYFENTYKYFINIYQVILNDNRDELLKYYLYICYVRLINYDNTIVLLESTKKDMYELCQYVFKNVDHNILESIKSSTGDYIIKKIKHYRANKCLEIGCNYGIHSLMFLSQQNATLISIDPEQSTKWNSYGKKLIKNLKFSDRHKMIEDDPLIVLPKLMNKHEFDIIFMNINDRFDLLVIYFYYSMYLLDQNGIIIIHHNPLNNSTNKFISFVDHNYSFCRKLESPVGVLCYKKITNEFKINEFNNF